MRKITLILSLCFFVFSGFAQRATTKVDKAFTFEYTQSIKGEADITDTLMPASFVGGTPTLYTASGGYVCGANGYGDEGKAQYFSTEGAMHTVEGVMLWIGAQTHETGNLVINVYDIDGQLPGTAISSDTIPFAQVTDTEDNEPGDFWFSHLFTKPVTVIGDYFVGVEFTGITSGFGLISTSEGDGGKDAYELWSDGGGWYSFLSASSWGLDIDQAIFPMVGIVNVPEVSIYDIQFTEDASGNSPYKGETVKTKGVVTALESKAFYIQDGAGAWNGIYVYQNAAPTVAVGDSVEVIAEVAEYYNLTELKNVTVTVINSDNAIEASEVTIGNVGEGFEGVLMMVKSVVVADAVNNFGEWTVTDATDTLKLDDVMVDFEPAVGTAFASISGVLTFSFGEFKLLPRDTADIVLLTKVSVTFNVDMTQPIDAEVFVVGTDVLYTTGNFAGWAAPGDEGSITLTDADGDKIYTAVVELDANYGEIQYKYFKNAGWDGGEWTGDPNRIATVADVDLTLNDTWVVGVNDESALSEVTMYPNPVVGNITVENLDKAALITVSNILGQNVMNVVVTNATMHINTEKLQSGVYMVTVIDFNNNTRTERIIKQ